MKGNEGVRNRDWRENWLFQVTGSFMGTSQDLKIEETSAVASWSWGLDEPKDKPSQTGSHDDSTGLLR